MYEVQKRCIWNLSPKDVNRCHGITEAWGLGGAPDILEVKSSLGAGTDRGDQRHGRTSKRRQEKRVFKSHGHLCQRLLRCRIRQKCKIDIKFSSVQVMGDLKQSWVTSGRD